MKKITASFLAILFLFSLFSYPVLAQPGRNAPASSQNAARKSFTSIQANKESLSEEVKNKAEKQTALEQKFQNSSLTKKARLENQIKIRQEIREKLASQKQEQLASQSPAFNDINSHWGAKSIKRLAALGLIKGYPDGSFKPEGEITQAEALSLIMRVAEKGEEAAETDNAENTATEELENIPDWAKKAARVALRHQIINLNRFHSQVQATRLQTAVWIAKALGIEPADTSNIPFKDGVLISKEDLGYIIALYNMGIIKGTPDGRFNPNSNITRAEIAAIIERILEKSAADEKAGSTEVTEENTSPSYEQTGETANTENASDSNLASGNEGGNSNPETIPAE